MGIGSIGSIGSIGINYNPYIYNTNSLSASSMNRVKAVSSDVSKPSTDYSALVNDELNVNTLKKGESSNFVDILESQMAMSRLNADRVMVPTGNESFE